MPKPKIVDWYTVNGKHVPVYEGQRKKAKYDKVEVVTHNKGKTAAKKSTKDSGGK